MNKHHIIPLLLSLGWLLSACVGHTEAPAEDTAGPGDSLATTDMTDGVDTHTDGGDSDEHSHNPDADESDDECQTELTPDTVMMPDGCAIPKLTLPFEKPATPPTPLPQDECYSIWDQGLLGEYLPWCSEKLLCDHVLNTYHPEWDDRLDATAVVCMLEALRDRQGGLLFYSKLTDPDLTDLVVEIVDDEIAVVHDYDEFMGGSVVWAIRLKEASYFQDCLNSDKDQQWACLWSLEDEDAPCVLGSEVVCPQ